MTTEYAIQYRTFMDGPFDRTLATDGNHKWTKEEAETEVYNWNHRRHDGAVEDIARVVKREVSEWVAA